MSTDAWIEEHWIGGAVLLRSRRAPKLPALPVPHAPTYSCGNAALAAHAQSRDSARHPGDCLSAWQDSRNVVDQQARKLTQPSRRSPQSRALSSPMRRRLPDLPGRPTGQAGVGVDVCLFTQEIDERPQRWAGMPTTRVVKEEPTEWWRFPIFKYG